MMVWILGHMIVKCLSSLNDFQKYLGGHLAPSSHFSILIELDWKASYENDLSIAPAFLCIIWQTQKFNLLFSYSINYQYLN
jgi:hypothetical protein